MGRVLYYFGQLWERARNTPGGLRGQAGVRSSFENHKACARRMTILRMVSCRSQGAPSDRTTYQSPILQEVRFCHFFMRAAISGLIDRRHARPVGGDNAGEGWFSEVGVKDEVEREGGSGGRSTVCKFLTDGEEAYFEEICRG